MRGGIYAPWEGCGTEDYDGRGYVEEERGETSRCCEEDRETEKIDEGG